MMRIATFLCFLLLINSTAWATDEAFGGVGLQVVPTAIGELVVLSVLPDAPAAKKGLMPGDLIYKVDDFILEGSEFGQVVSEHLWGPIDSKVEIFYRRPGVAGEATVVLQRTRINPRLTVTPTVKSGTDGDSGSQ